MAKPKASGGRVTPRSEHPDAFDMLGNGKCEMWLDGTQWKFRRPRLGEFRDMREQMYDLQDNALRLAAAVNEANAAARAEQTPADATVEVAQTERVEHALEVKKRIRAMDNEITTQNALWVEGALNLLSESGDLPDQADWLPEMVEPTFVVRLVDHWRHVPLAPGGGAQTPTL